MTVLREHGLEIRYYPGRIELWGEVAPIHVEADRILLRFRYSTTPYKIIEDGDDHMVLVPVQSYGVSQGASD